MSRVTNVILSFDIMEESHEDEDGRLIYHLMAPINAWLINEGYGPFGADADGVSGGMKHLETPIYVAAFNHFDVTSFVTMLSGLPWEDAPAVQVFVKEQEDHMFRMIQPCA